MILHFITDVKFGSMFIEYVKSNFNINDHYFIFVGSKKFTVPEDIHFFSLSKKNIFRHLLETLRLISEADKVFVHYLALQELYFFMGLCKKNLSKFNWIMFGGDIYNENYGPFQVKLINGFIESIYSVCYLIEEDYEYLVNRFEVKPRAFHVQYTSNIGSEKYIDILNQNLKSYNDSDKELLVVVGNSASKENNHEEMFSYITRIQDVLVYCPLSYGDLEYGKRIIDIGYKLFSDRFRPLTSFLPYEDYLKVLCKMDFGIYGYKRQQGLGNIRPLLLMGKKVFLPENTVLFKHFSKLFPNQVFNIAEIGLFSEDDLRARTDIHIDMINALYGTENINKLWNTVMYENNE